jgi:hypothetical protein
MGVHDENLLYIDKDAVEARHPKKVVSGNAQGAHDGKLMGNGQIAISSGAVGASACLTSSMVGTVYSAFGMSINFIF